MPEFKPTDIQRLLEQSAEKAEVALTHSDMELLAEKANQAYAKKHDNSSMERLTRKYLYDTLHSPAKHGKSVHASSAYVNVLASYLGFRTFEEWQKVQSSTALTVVSEPKSGAIDITLVYHRTNGDGFPKALQDALSGRGLNVWNQHTNLQIGDSRWGGINAALTESNYVLVVLSRSLWHDRSTRLQLLAAFEQEQHDAQRILPILHGVSEAEIVHSYPILADHVAGNSSTELHELASAIERAITSR